MSPDNQAKMINFLQQVAVNTQDKIALLQNELSLSAIAKTPNFTGIEIDDVYAIEIRVKQDGAPVDGTHIARITFVEGDTPTTSHGMYLGNGDLYTVTGKANIAALKIISADGGAHTANLVFYGV